MRKQEDKMDDMIKKIDRLSQKIDSMPSVIQGEISKALVICGVDPNNPYGTQEMVLWVKESMQRDKKTVTRVRNLFVDCAVKGLVFLITLGFIAFYTQSVVKYAIREDNPQIKITQGKDK